MFLVGIPFPVMPIAMASPRSGAPPTPRPNWFGYGRDDSGGGGGGGTNPGGAYPFDPAVGSA